MSRMLAAALLAALVVLPACGSGDTDTAATGTIVRGPLVIGLPLLSETAAEVLEVGLRNLKEFDAAVTLTAYLPTGAAYPPGAETVTVPALGGVRFPLSRFTGAALGAGGWLEVETRNVAVLDPATGEPTLTETSGYVAAYMQRSATGLEIDSALGAAFREEAVAFVSINPYNQAYQIINRSFVPAPGGATPTAITVDVTVYDAFGAVFATSTEALPANGSSLFVPTVTDRTGRVEVVPTPGQPVPAGTEFRVAAAALEADPQVFVEARLTEVQRPIPQRFVGFDLEFGRDFVNNTHDFAVVLTNPTTTDATVLLEQIYRDDGTPILTTPRVIGLDAKRTKFLATTNFDSQGLDVGEVSPFADLFGEVALATTAEAFTMTFNVPGEISISARAFSPFKDFYRILPGRKLTTDVMVCGVAVPTTTFTGLRNFVSLMNPRNNEIQVNVRGHTPGGTEYVVGSVFVPALGRLDWSPDGLLFTEDPTDTTGVPVPFMAFRFTAQGGMFFNARRDRRDGRDYILTIVPHAVRDLSAD